MPIGDRDSHELLHFVSRIGDPSYLQSVHGINEEIDGIIKRYKKYKFVYFEKKKNQILSITLNIEDHNYIGH